MRDDVVKYCADIVDRSHLKIGQLIKMLCIHRSKYYVWLHRLGTENLHNGKQPKSHWLTPDERRRIIDFAGKFIASHQYYLQDGYRRIAYMGIDENAFACSPTSVYRVLSKAGLLSKWKNKSRCSKGKGFKQPLTPHQHWHTDIKYINFKGTFLFFISIMDGYSRYIVHHELRKNMTEFDIEIVLQKAIEKYPEHKPKLITDNGSQYISNDFKYFLKEVGLRHVKTSPSYPQSNGKIERFHRSLEEECVRTTSMIDINDAKEQIAKYVEHYNNQRLHSSLFYLRPIDFLNGDIKALLNERQKKLDTASCNRKNFWENKNNVA